jgi:hypothetical protein
MVQITFGSTRIVLSEPLSHLLLMVKARRLGFLVLLPEELKSSSISKSLRNLLADIDADNISVSKALVGL